MSDAELRIWTLEGIVMALQAALDAAEVRLAGVEQQQYQGDARPPVSGLIAVKNTGGAISSGSTGTVTAYLDDGITLGSTTYPALLTLSGTWALNKNGYIAQIGSKYHSISADC